MPLSVPLLLCALLVVTSAPGASARPIDSPPFGLPDGGGRPFDFDTPLDDPPPFDLPTGSHSGQAIAPVDVVREDGLIRIEMRHPNGERLGIDSPFHSLEVLTGVGEPPLREGPAAPFLPDPLTAAHPALSIDRLAATTPIAGPGGLVQVPEPASSMLLGLGVVALASFRRLLGASI